MWYVNLSGDSFVFKWGHVKNFMHYDIIIQVNVYMCFFGVLRVEMVVQ